MCYLTCIMLKAAKTWPKKDKNSSHSTSEAHTFPQYLHSTSEAHTFPQYLIVFFLLAAKLSNLHMNIDI